LLSGALVVPLTDTAAGAEGSLDQPPAVDATGACDFQRSFMTWDFPFRPDPRPHARHNIPHGNMARILLDAMIDVIDRQTGMTERFVLIAPCRAEWVYAEDHLFQLPSREYRNIYSLTEQRGVERQITCAGEPSRGSLVSNDFRSLKIDVCTYGRTRRLSTPAEIVQATAANLPLVARTHLDDPARAVQYVLEYPVRTMNFQPKTNSFQVDTGPLLVPDFASQAERAIDRLEMAHVAYNRLDRAEFILRRPTPITDSDGKTLCQVLHYSEVCEHPARNGLLAGEA
jgi:hypothetical protein